MFEHHSQPLVTNAAFLRRLGKLLLGALLVFALSLAIGMWGYGHFEGMKPVDALLNASMILGGMGPADTLHTDGGKIFASLYALYSGLVLIGITGIFLGTLVHRVLHSFHASQAAKPFK